MRRHDKSALPASVGNYILRFVLLLFAVGAFIPLMFLPWMWLDGDPRSAVLQFSSFAAICFGSGAFLVNGAATGRFRVAWFVGPAALAFVLIATAALLTPRHAQIDIQTEVNLFSNVSFPTKPDVTAFHPNLPLARKD